MKQCILPDLYYGIVPQTDNNSIQHFARIVLRKLNIQTTLFVFFLKFSRGLLSAAKTETEMSQSRRTVLCFARFCKRSRLRSRLTARSCRLNPTSIRHWSLTPWKACVYLWVHWNDWIRSGSVHALSHNYNLHAQTVFAKILSFCVMTRFRSCTPRCIIQSVQNVLCVILL